MLTHKLLEQLRGLRLTGIADALERQLTQPATHEDLSFEERLALLINAEALARENRRVERLLRSAKLRFAASDAHANQLLPVPVGPVIRQPWCLCSQSPWTSEAMRSQQHKMAEDHEQEQTKHKSRGHRMRL